MNEPAQVTNLNKSQVDDFGDILPDNFSPEDMEVLTEQTITNVKRWASTPGYTDGKRYLRNRVIPLLRAASRGGMSVERRNSRVPTTEIGDCRFISEQLAYLNSAKVSPIISTDEGNRIANPLFLASNRKYLRRVIAELEKFADAKPELESLRYGGRQKVFGDVVVSNYTNRKLPQDTQFARVISFAVRPGQEIDFRQLNIPNEDYKKDRQSLQIKGYGEIQVREDRTKRVYTIRLRPGCKSFRINNKEVEIEPKTKKGDGARGLSSWRSPNGVTYLASPGETHAGSQTSTSRTDEKRGNSTDNIKGREKAWDSENSYQNPISTNASSAGVEPTKHVDVGSRNRAKHVQNFKVGLPAENQRDWYKNVITFEVDEKTSFRFTDVNGKTGSSKPYGRNIPSSARIDVHYKNGKKYYTIGVYHSCKELKIDGIRIYPPNRETTSSSKREKTEKTSTLSYGEFRSGAPSSERETPSKVETRTSFYVGSGSTAKHVRKFDVGRPTENQRDWYKKIITFEVDEKTSFRFTDVNGETGTSKPYGRNIPSSARIDVHHRNGKKYYTIGIYHGCKELKIDGKVIYSDASDVNRARH